MKIIFSTLILAFGITALLAGDIATLADARVLAKRLNKPILIDFWSDN